MIYLFTYQEIKQHTEERNRRALRKFEQRRRAPIDSYVRPTPDVDADVIELMFGARCESEPIGA
jgi:hypothetical protein